MLKVSTLFSSIFWSSAEGFPGKGSQAIEILIEVVFFIDVCVKIKWRSLTHRSLYFLIKYSFSSTSESIKLMFFLISSFPFVVVLLIAKRISYFDLDNGYYSLLLAFKILRIWDLKLYVNKLQRLLIFTNFTSILFFKLAESFFMMVCITHVSSCLWLLVNKFGKESKNYI